MDRILNGTDCTNKNTELRYNNCDLTAALITNDGSGFSDLEETALEDFIKLVNKIMVIPLPMPYILALRERKILYHKWSKNILVSLDT